MVLNLAKRTGNEPTSFTNPPGCSAPGTIPHGRPTVFDILPDEVGTGLHTAGRLDMDAEGLLILTNDGDLTLTLTHPSSHLPKTYLVKVKGEVLLRSLKKLRRGVELEDGTTLPASVSVIKGKGTERNTWLRMVLKEGKKNQIKRMGEAVGNRVISIKRISIGGMELPEKMKPGSFKKLSRKEIETLMGGKDRIVQSPMPQDPRDGREDREKADQSPSAFADGHRTASTDRKSEGQRERRGEVREQTDPGKPRRGDTETRRRGEVREQPDTGTRRRGDTAVQEGKHPGNRQHPRRGLIQNKHPRGHNSV